MVREMINSHTAYLLRLLKIMYTFNKKRLSMLHIFSIDSLLVSVFPALGHFDTDCMLVIKHWPNSHKSLGFFYFTCENVFLFDFKEKKIEFFSFDFCKDK